MVNKPTYEELGQRVKELEKEVAEYKRAKNQLSQERDIFLKSPVVAFKWSAREDWPAEYVSPNVDQFGYQADDFTSNKRLYIDIIYPEDLERVVSEVQAHIDSGASSYGQEYRIIQDDGEIRWVYDYTVVNRVNKTEIISFDGYILDITKRKRAEMMLKESERKFRAIFDHTFQFIGLMTADGTLVDANKAALDFAGVEAKDVLGKPFWETVWWRHSTELQERLKGAIAKAANGHFERFEAFHPALDGTVHYVDVSIQPVKDEEGNVHFLIPEGRNITERKHAEKEIKASLSEKKVLLKEIHHRVKNNFEIICSLLDMSSTNKENREFQNLCEDAETRIYSMSLVHDQLYQSDRFDQIDMGRHIQQLAGHLSRVYKKHGKWITTTIESSQVYLSVNQAIPCALVLNEIIANAFKHAFKVKRKGAVHISIKDSIDDKVIIKVKDDGDSISEGTDFDDTTSLGLKLVRLLVERQLNGKVNIGNDNGTEIRIEFKKLKR